jgi:hypothetical protein
MCTPKKKLSFYWNRIQVALSVDSHLIDQATETNTSKQLKILNLKLFACVSLSTTQAHTSKHKHKHTQANTSTSTSTSKQLKILNLKTKISSVAWVREWTILSERPPLVDKVSVNFNFFLRIEGVAWLARRLPTAVISLFSRPEPHTEISHLCWDQFRSDVFPAGPLTRLCSFGYRDFKSLWCIIERSRFVWDVQDCFLPRG